MVTDSFLWLPGKQCSAVIDCPKDCQTLPPAVWQASQPVAPRKPPQPNVTVPGSRADQKCLPFSQSECDTDGTEQTEMLDRSGWYYRGLDWQVGSFCFLSLLHRWHIPPETVLCVLWRIHISTTF